MCVGVGVWVGRCVFVEGCVHVYICMYACVWKKYFFGTARLTQAVGQKFAKVSYARTTSIFTLNE